MMQEQDIYLDHRLDKIGALLTKLQRAAAGTAREEARSELCKAAIEDDYEFFVGNFMRYQLNQIGDSYLYQVPTIPEFGTIQEIAMEFGGASQLRDAVIKLQEMLYAS